MDPIALRELFAAIRSRAGGEPSAMQFIGADLRGAFLLRADLGGGLFQRSQLDHASLPGARLVGTNLQATSLVGVDLNGADLTGANLSGADLSEARVEAACLAGVNCLGACLRHLRGHPASVAGMLLDHAAFERSQMSDAELIQLWRDGATIQDLGAFSDRVRHACCEVPHEISLLDIHSRDVAIAEAHQRTSLMPNGGPEAFRQQILHVSTPPNRILDLFGSASAALKAGDHFLGFTLIKCIGNGPNGSVWKAQHDSEQGFCAVKLFEPKAGFHETKAGVFKRGSDTLNRIAILDEAQRIRLVRVRAVALNGLGFVYDYYDNGNMTGLSVLGWDLQRNIEFFSDICRSVAEMHELGIAHRALKPQNVLVNDDLRPVLTDAGMIEFVSPDLVLPSAGRIYQAPEELGGESTLSPTADIYSLGMLLWFLLQGCDPDERIQGLAQLHSLQKYPAGILRIIRKATAQEPALRYQWVRELEQDLANYRSHENVGLSGLVADTNVRPYCISSLPAPRLALKQQTNASGTAVSDRVGRPTPVSSRRAAAWLSAVAALGVACAACALAVLLIPSTPSPTLARSAGLALTLGIALASLIIAPLKTNPLLSRVVVFAGICGLGALLGPERLAIVRWRMTLSNGGGMQRAKAAKYLARGGAKNLKGAELSGTDLRGADFGNVILQNANLAKANLAGANLAEANVHGAKFSGVDLRGANLLASNVEYARDFTSAECNRLTRLPRGWQCRNGHPNHQR